MKCTRCNGTGEEPANNGGPPEQLSLEEVPRSVTRALDHCQTLGKVPRLRRPGFWAAEYRATPDVSHDQQILRAEAWLWANPTKAPKKDFPAFLHRWLAKAQAEAAEEPTA